MTIASRDVLTPADLALGAYARAKEPKQLQLLPCGHFEAYSGPYFERNAGTQTEFLKKCLVRVGQQIDVICAQDGEQPNRANGPTTPSVTKETPSTVETTRKRPKKTISRREDTLSDDEPLVDTTAALTLNSKKTARLQKRQKKRQAQKVHSDIQSFLDFPPELISLIFSFLQPSDIYTNIRCDIEGNAECVEKSAAGYTIRRSRAKRANAGAERATSIGTSSGSSDAQLDNLLMHWDERSAKVVVIQQSQAAELPATPDEPSFSIDRPFSPGLTLLTVAWCIVLISDLFMRYGYRYVHRFTWQPIPDRLALWRIDHKLASIITYKVRESRDGPGAAKEEDGSGDEISGERSDFDQTDEGNDVHEDQERLRNSKERLCSGRPSIVSLAQDRTTQVCTQVYHSFAPVCDLDQVHANDKRRPALFTGVTNAEHPLIYILNPSPEESIPEWS
ncbi:hypothetical protein LTR92_010798 [Exophiala xenobiotica]|nr:hypothetical protein LTR92_010798 [Exophiala xenobiotica]